MVAAESRQNLVVRNETVRIAGSPFMSAKEGV